MGCVEGTDFPTQEEIEEAKSEEKTRQRRRKRHAKDHKKSDKAGHPPNRYEITATPTNVKEARKRDRKDPKVHLNIDDINLDIPPGGGNIGCETPPVGAISHTHTPSDNESVDNLTRRLSRGGTLYDNRNIQAVVYCFDQVIASCVIDLSHSEVLEFTDDEWADFLFANENRVSRLASHIQIITRHDLTMSTPLFNNTSPISTPQMDTGGAPPKLSIVSDTVPIDMPTSTTTPPALSNEASDHVTPLKSPKKGRRRVVYVISSQCCTQTLTYLLKKIGWFDHISNVELRIAGKDHEYFGGTVTKNMCILEILKRTKYRHDCLLYVDSDPQVCTYFESIRLCRTFCVPRKTGLTDEDCIKLEKMFVST